MDKILALNEDGSVKITTVVQSEEIVSLEDLISQKLQVQKKIALWQTQIEVFRANESELDQLIAEARSAGAKTKEELLEEENAKKE